MDLRHLSPSTPMARMNTMGVPWSYRGNAVLETCVSMGGKLLEFMGLYPMEYRILYVDWSRGAV